MTLPRTVGGLLLVALVACREQARPAADVPAWRAELVTTIGSDSGEASFTEIRSVLLGRENELYVVDPRAKEVKVFDSAGRFLRRVGRTGAGPGEFKWPYSLAWLHDTLAVLDPGNSRIEMFDRDGKAAGQLQSQAISGGSQVRLYRTPGPTFWNFGSSSGKGLLIRYTSAGPQDTLSYLAVPIPGTTTITCEFPDRSLHFFDAPFAPMVLQVPTPTGERAIARTDAYRITFVGPVGDTVRTIGPNEPLQPIADSAWEAGLQEWTEARKTSGIKCDGDTFDRPAGKPILAALFYDDQGRLWVEVHSVDGIRYDVYDAKGALLRVVTGLPSSGEVDPSVHGDRIALTYVDKEGTPLVGIYRFEGAP